jgi:hypothetical protein
MRYRAFDAWGKPIGDFDAVVTTEGKRTDKLGAMLDDRRVTKKGRPNSGNALTPSEKQKAYRERKKAK